MKKEKKEILISFIKNKLNLKQFILASNELPKKDLYLLLDEMKIIRRITKGYYLIFIPNWRDSFEDIITNTYNSNLVNYFLNQTDSYLSEKESYDLYIGNTSKRLLNISVYRKKSNIIQNLDISWKIKIKISKQIELKFPLEFKTIYNTWFEIMNPIDILIRLSDKRTNISWDHKFKTFVINTIEIDQSMKSKILQRKIINTIEFKNILQNLFREYKNTRVESILHYIFDDIIKNWNLPKDDFWFENLEKNKIIDWNSNVFLSKRFSSLILTENEKNNELLSPYLEIFDSVFSILPEFQNIKEPTFSSGEIKKIAIKNKKNDVYHSTTIEGYDITHWDVEIFMGYKPEDFEHRSLKELEKIIAVKWYARAFEYIVNNPIQKLSPEYFLDIYKMLWYYSFQINEVSEYDQKKFRTTQKHMRGSIWYSMPNPYIIFNLVDIYCININSIKNPLLKAIVAHFLFPPIQALEDWNWRTSRLTMNSILISNNMQWKTVEDHQYRLTYLSQWKIHWDEDLANRIEIQNTFRQFLAYMLSINNQGK